jgi:methionyl-tRNA formyltransferase
VRVVLLCSSLYSETSYAAAAHLAQRGFVPVGALTLPSWDRQTIARKVGQWGLRESLSYARLKLAKKKPEERNQFRNPHLAQFLQQEGRVFRNLRELSKHYDFPIAVCGNQNSDVAIWKLKEWKPDIGVFTGGNIVRQPLLDVFRIGILNAHLALLPEVRGMSSPEWSLLCHVPLGVTIHLLDAGIDTGPIIFRREFTPPKECESLVDLRNRMIAHGIELIGEAIRALEQGQLSPVPQAEREYDHQYFVMHDSLKAWAAHRLKSLQSTDSGTTHV